MFNLMQNSTIHGIGHISNSNNKYGKLIWIFLFVFGIGGIISNATLLVIRFMSKPVMINQEVNNKPFIWPQITFCNPTSPFFLADDSVPLNNWLAKYKQSFNYYKKMNELKNKVQERRTLTLSTIDPDKMDYKNIFNHFQLFTSSYISDKINYKYSYEDRSDIIENITSFCTFPLVRLQNNIPCYSFHLDKYNNKMISSFFIMIIFHYDSLQIFTESFYLNSIYMYISNRNELPSGKPISLQPNYDHTISLSQINHERIGILQPCRKKNFEIDLYDASLLSTRKLEGSYKMCLQIAVQRKYVMECNCYDPFLPIYKNESGFPRICLNMTYFSKKQIFQNSKCIRQVSVNDYLKNFEGCEIFKLIKCEETTYNIDHDQDNSRKRPKNKETSETTKQYCTKHKKRQCEKHYIRLQIKTTSQFGNLIKEELQYPFPQLLSDIGGLMGLWLGLSIVGLFEILQFIYAFLNDSCKINSRKKKRQSPSQSIMLDQKL